MLNIKKPVLYKLASTLNDILIISIIILLCLVILLFPEEISMGILNGIKTCINVLIPSLFPFMILSSFIIKSGLSEKIGNFISPAIKFLFNLPGVTASTIILSLIAGYPIGATGIESLLQKNVIDKEQANRMLAFCVGAGPAFIINVVGNNLLKNKSLGIIIFISQIFASVLIGILLGIYSRIQKNIIKESKIESSSIDSMSKTFVQACLNSVDSMTNMCVFVIIFSSVITLIYNTNIYVKLINILQIFYIPLEYSKCIIPILLEVTMGCTQAINNLLPIEILALAVSWAGVCVHFQIISSLKSLHIPYLNFVLQRLLHSLIALIICHNILLFIEYPKSVFSNVQNCPQPSMSSNLNGCINLFLICTLFVSALILKISVKVKD